MAAILSKRVLAELKKLDAENYRKQLTSLGMKKKQVEDMVAAFQDGEGSIVHHLVGMGVVELVEGEDK